MKISEIKNKELRELAELRRSESDWEFDNDLENAFEWCETKEGRLFWLNVKKGIITELPKENKQSTTKEDLETLLAQKEKEIESIKEVLKLLD